MYPRNRVNSSLANNQPLTETDLRGLETALVEIGEEGGETLLSSLLARSGTPSLGHFVHSLVGMARSAAQSACSEFLGDRSLTPQQIRFVEMVIDQLTARGVMDASALYIVLCPCGQWPATLSALRSGALILRTLMRCVVFWAFTLFLWFFSRC